MLHFENSKLLYLLLLWIPVVLIWVGGHYIERKRIQRWADESMFARLLPDYTFWRPLVKMILLSLGYCFLVVALANPQLGTKMEKAKRQGSDVAICMDVSNSMMAEDIAPNRLERSKHVVNNLLGSLAGDRVSLVVFAGTSFIQMPLTNDYGAVKLFLDQIECEMITSQGTAIGDAIEKAMTTFGYGNENAQWSSNKGRAIIVISDGENFEDDAVAAAKNAAKEGVRVSTIGMGRTSGTPIPEYSHRTRKNSYKHDRSGSIVMTRLNEQMLQDIAAAGKGVYVHAGNVNSGLGDITRFINGLDKEEIDEAVFSSYESQYIYPLVAALLCFVAELFIFERKNRKWTLFKQQQKQ